MTDPQAGEDGNRNPADRLRWPVAIATLAGIGLAAWAIGRAGGADLLRAARALGAGGFLLICLATLGTMLLLGAAWLAALPGERAARLPLFAAARTVREGANDLLPFSQIGGLVVGTRLLTRAGLEPARVYAAVMVDLTTEMVSQIAFTLPALGGWLLAARGTFGSLAWLGVGAMIALAAAVALLQRAALRLVRLIGTRLLPNLPAQIARIEDALDRCYRARGHVAASFLFNLLAWISSALTAWLALMLMGNPLSVRQVMALESLIFALRSSAFVVPGALGVQEAGYLLLAGTFGIAPGVAVALSLVKRAREVAIGLPALLLWQAAEWRSARRASTSGVATW